MLIVVNRQKRPPIPDYCPDGYAELLEDCWRQSHLERPGFPEVTLSLMLCTLECVCPFQIVDRLKDLLEEETANQMALEAEPSTPVTAAQNENPNSVAREMPSFPSGQPMGREYGCVVPDLFSSRDSTFF